MSIPDSGSAPERRDPRPRKPVRPSILPFTRTLLDQPFQPFEWQMLERITASERNFRIFCMFGRPICAPLSGCERPIVIRGRAYDSGILRALYLGTAAEHLLTQTPEQASSQLLPINRESDSAATSPVPSITPESMIRQLLQPLLHDALLMELGTRPDGSPRLGHIGVVLATLCFEHFARCADPVQAVRDLAEELCMKDLLWAPIDSFMEVGDAPLFELAWRATDLGKDRISTNLMPKWECARVRRTRKRG